MHVWHMCAHLCVRTWEHRSTTKHMYAYMHTHTHNFSCMQWGSFTAIMTSRTRESSCFSPNTCPTIKQEETWGQGQEGEVACTQELTGWDSSREGGRRSLVALGQPLPGRISRLSPGLSSHPEALVELASDLICVSPDSFQPWPCSLPVRTKSEHLWWLLLPKSHRLSYTRVCRIPATLAAAVAVS